MKKFTIYFMIHLLGLAVISFIFIQILKKDIPDNKPFELEYKNEIVKISWEDTGTPVIDAGTPTSFAFGVGFLWSEDRIIQLHLWKSLFQGNIAYTI
ncbi:MAG: penicillin acylase family protein, partial [Calditrichia bacterium]|nr:penicillin acylase family protein [Calditrichia bacterium]